MKVKVARVTSPSSSLVKESLRTKLTTIDYYSHFRNFYLVVYLSNEYTKKDIKQLKRSQKESIIKRRFKCQIVKERQCGQQDRKKCLVFISSSVIVSSLPHTALMFSFETIFYSLSLLSLELFFLLWPNTEASFAVFLNILCFCLGFYVHIETAHKECRKGEETERTSCVSRGRQIFSVLLSKQHLV